MLRVYALNAFSDNYIWVIENTNNKDIVVVDPGDATPVIEEIENRNLNLKTILITHHHHDHVGGVVELTKKFSEVNVYGPFKEKIAGVKNKLSEDSEVSLLDGNLELKVIDVPGHTLGHIAYYGNDMLFCGDTLFAAGCGRVFEGTHEQMFESLEKLRSLPKNTKVYCAHEYTLSNLKFARYVEPNNKEIKNKIKEVEKILQLNNPTLPSTIEAEFLTNPFFRTKEKAIVAAAMKYTNEKNLQEWQIFGAIREMKDYF